MWYDGYSWFVFHPDGRVFKYSTLPFEDISNKFNWLLLDAQNPPPSAARTILVTSPRRERFKEFANHSHVREIIMPLWDIEELLDLQKCEFAELDQNHVLELCRFWGPVPRSVLTHAGDMRYQAYQKTLMAALTQQSLYELIQKLADTTYPYGIMSGRVIHMETDESYTSCHPRFASDHLTNQFFGRQGGQRFSDMVKFLKDTAGDSAFAATRGIAFELYAHIRLRKGGQFTVSFNSQKGENDMLTIYVRLANLKRTHWTW